MTTLSAKDNAVFENKNITTQTVTIGTREFCSEAYPDQLTVSCLDENGMKIELLFQGGRKDLFESIREDIMRDENGNATVQVTGYWNKRMWKMTKVPGNRWGYTWQIGVAEMSYTNSKNETASLGEVPTFEVAA